MDHIENLLTEIRRRPGMYIGAPSLLRLAFFLRGYELAAGQIGRLAPSTLLPGFRDWVQNRFGSTQMSWEDLIIADAGDDRAAFDRFWRLLDEFLAARSDGNGSGAVRPLKSDIT